jgi:hypothetical protein
MTRNADGTVWGTRGTLQSCRFDKYLHTVYAIIVRATATSWVREGWAMRSEPRGAASASAGIAPLLTTAILLLAGCTAAHVAVAPDASGVRVGTQPPGSAHEQLGAVTAKHGGGCGLYGTRGDYEGAYTLLRNKAAQLGADYVQIIKVTEPRLEGICMNQSYVLDGMAYRITGPPPVVGASTPPAQTPPRPAGLTGTYAGEITGNSAGRIFKMAVTFTIVQSGNEIAGAWTTTGGASGTVTGVLTESGIRDLRARQLNPCGGEFGGVAVLEAGMTLRGSYIGQDCSGSVTASFAVTRQ